MAAPETFTPIGTILPWVGADPATTEVQGWLSCDGRVVSTAEHQELFAAIGSLWGPSSDTTFTLPDLRGQFLRGTTDSTARDPDLALRVPLGTGTNTDPGSSQTYGTAPPTATFRTTLPNLAQSAAPYIDGCYAGPARATPSGTADSTTPASSGGDAETRPDNLYVWFLIKARGVVDNHPVEVPIGSLMAFAGIDTDGFDDNWLDCTGDDYPPLGVFAPLFDVIGYAHGRQRRDDSDNFVLPDYRDAFLRGVTGPLPTDPDASLRESPHDPEGGQPSGNAGDMVGSRQDWATALPVAADVSTAYPAPPSSDASISTPGTDRTFYKRSTGTAIYEVTSDGGDTETRPANVRVGWHIRYQ